MSNLTKRKLLAIEEALHARLAGAIDHDGPPVQRDYEHALSWVQQELERRNQPSPSTGTKAISTA